MGVSDEEFLECEKVSSLFSVSANQAIWKENQFDGCALDSLNYATKLFGEKED